MKFIDIADIRAGYSFRESINPSFEGDISVVQFKNLEGIVISSVDHCVQISSDNIKSSHFLKINDILLSSRGNYKASVFKCLEKSIASGVFFVLTLKNEKFLPEYIAVYLNSQEGQKALLSRQNSAGVISIIRSELEQIDIPLIPLQKQKQIVELFLLYEKEVDTMEKIKQNRKKLINSILSETIKE